MEERKKKKAFQRDIKETRLFSKKGPVPTNWGKRKEKCPKKHGTGKARPSEKAAGGRKLREKMKGAVVVG